MSAEMTPMRWPAAWRHASNLGLIQGTGINYLLIENQTGMTPVISMARQNGVQVETSAPTGVSLLKGLWPGIQLSRSGKEGQADSGPTGEPWVNSNGWRIGLETAEHPGTAVWVHAAPPEGEVPLNAYFIAMADAAIYRGRWILTLAEGFAGDVAGGKPQALSAWKQLMSAASFFAAPKPWAHYLPMAVVGVISDFSGKNKSLSQELLNMLGRANQQYRIILKKDVSAASLMRLRAAVYVDIEGPTADLRAQILHFVETGGLLITRDGWRPLSEDATLKTDEHPRFSIGDLGKGRVAIANGHPSDPFLLANDSVTLVSRRYDLVRFWNLGPAGSQFMVSTNDGKAAAQIVSYAEPGVYGPTVGVAGMYRKARLWRYDQTGPEDVEMAIQKDRVEVHLPPISVYAAVELET
jgi:hypothetical protein